MQPIAELFLKLAVTVALYRKKYTKQDQMLNKENLKT